MEDILDIDKEMAAMSKNLTAIRFNEQRLTQVSSRIDEMVSIHKTNIAVVLITVMSNLWGCIFWIMFLGVDMQQAVDSRLWIFPYLGPCLILLFWGSQTKYGDIISALINIVYILLLPPLLFIHAYYLIFAMLPGWIYAIFRSYKFRKEVKSISISGTRSGEQI